MVHAEGMLQTVVGYQECPPLVEDKKNPKKPFVSTITFAKCIFLLQELREHKIESNVLEVKKEYLFSWLKTPQTVNIFNFGNASAKFILSLIPIPLE